MPERIEVGDNDVCDVMLREQGKVTSRFCWTYEEMRRSFLHQKKWIGHGFAEWLKKKRGKKKESEERRREGRRERERTKESFQRNDFVRSQGLADREYGSRKDGIF